MTDLALDPLTGDIVIAAGDLQLVTGPRAIAQDANLRVALFKGEWPLDLRVGIDYPNLIFDRRPPEPVIRAIYDQVLRETAGVKSVDRLTIAFESGSRMLTVRASVTAHDGTVVPIYRDILLDAPPPLTSDPAAVVGNRTLGTLTPFGSSSTYSELDR